MCTAKEVWYLWASSGWRNRTSFLLRIIPGYARRTSFLCASSPLTRESCLAMESTLGRESDAGPRESL